MHIHTKYSDGTYSPKEVLERAEKLGLKYISITDHDNCRAYNEFKDFDINFFLTPAYVPFDAGCRFANRLPYITKDFKIGAILKSKAAVRQVSDSYCTLGFL